MWERTHGKPCGVSVLFRFTIASIRSFLSVTPPSLWSVKCLHIALLANNHAKITGIVLRRQLTITLGMIRAHEARARVKVT